MSDPREKRNLLGPYIPQGSLIREVVQQVKLVYGLMLDARVAWVTKLIPAAALAYLILPLEPTDLLPILGQLDDVAIVMLGVRFFLELAPAEVVREHLARLAAAGQWDITPPPAPGAPPKPDGEVVDGTYKVED
ncbi:MAG: DUF1232 domain-containing protein [Anaerolineales bacterium]|nr:DUF1232 domain-containing protein [Anaerolineales bacterium]